MLPRDGPRRVAAATLSVVAPLVVPVPLVPVAGDGPAPPIPAQAVHGVAGLQAEGAVLPVRAPGVDEEGVRVAPREHAPQAG